MGGSRPRKYEATVVTAAADVAADKAAGARREETRPRAVDEAAWTSTRNVASVDKAVEPPCRTSLLTRPWRRERKGGGTARRGRGRVDCGEERRLRGQGRQTAVQDVPAHEAAAAGEERGE